MKQCKKSLKLESIICHFFMIFIGIGCFVGGSGLIIDVITSCKSQTELVKMYQIFDMSTILAIVVGIFFASIGILLCLCTVKREQKNILDKSREERLKYRIVEVKIVRMVTFLFFLVLGLIFILVGIVVINDEGGVGWPVVLLGSILWLLGISMAISKTKEIKKYKKIMTNGDTIIHQRLTNYFIKMG